MLQYKSVCELVRLAAAAGKNISEIVLEDQAEQLGRSREDVYLEMERSFRVMQEAVARGETAGLRSPSGLSGGAAEKMKRMTDSGDLLGGKVFGKLITKALAAAEVNACMGRIVAAPTAGSCGILPAVLCTVKEDRNIGDAKVVMSLFTAAAFGMVIANQASISGAEGGCQAECGSASAMAAAALVEMVGGTPEMAENACAIALKNLLGLVCDPVAGLVEVPCIKRNAAGAVNAMAAAEMARAGIISVIPADEVISAMKSIGDAMPCSLKETAEGGLADTPTAHRIAQRFSQIIPD